MRMAPDRDKLLRTRWLAPFAHRLAETEIWQFNRRSVSRGIALGLFAGFLLPVGQIVLAALLAGSARANVLIAAAATLVTNPLTFPPIYYAAYRTGSFILGARAEGPVAVPDGASGASAGLWQAFTGTSLATMTGLLIFAIGSSLLAFCAVHLVWRISLSRQWRRRKHALRK